MLDRARTPRRAFSREQSDARRRRHPAARVCRGGSAGIPSSRSATSRGTGFTPTTAARDAPLLVPGNPAGVRAGVDRRCACRSAAASRPSRTSKPSRSSRGEPATRPTRRARGSVYRRTADSCSPRSADTASRTSTSAALASLEDWLVVVTSNVRARRREADPAVAAPAQAPGYDDDESDRLPDTVRFIDERDIYAAGFRYEDLVAAVDVVATKPGIRHHRRVCGQRHGHPVHVPRTLRRIRRDGPRKCPATCAARSSRTRICTRDDGRRHSTRLITQPAPPERPRGRRRSSRREIHHSGH